MKCFNFFILLFFFLFLYFILFFTFQSIAYDTDGLSLAVGTSSGHVLLYDIRSNTPLIIKDHQYGLPIKKIKYHSTSGKMITADSKIIKIWERNSVSIFYILNLIKRVIEFYFY